MMDPDPLAERQRSVPRSEMKMNDGQSLGDKAEIDAKLEEKFDL